MRIMGFEPIVFFKKLCLLYVSFKNDYSFTSAPHLLTKLRLRYLDCLVDIYTEHSHRLRPHRDDFCTFLLIFSAKPDAASHAKDLKDFHIGVMDKGLFQAWLSHRGISVTGFPESRKQAERSDFCISLDELLCHIPELQNVMQETEENYKPFFLFPCYDVSLNFRHFLQERPYKRKYEGSYLDFLNLEGKHDPDWEKKLIESFLGPFTIVGEYKERDSNGWRIFVKHQEGTNHFDSYNSHKGLSASMVLAPLFGRTDDWEVFAVMILYALSIIVRYMPNLWARILHGDLDNYKAVFYQFSRVAERELTQIFLEKLTGKNILITHPQGIL